VNYRPLHCPSSSLYLSTSFIPAAASSKPIVILLLRQQQDEAAARERLYIPEPALPCSVLTAVHLLLLLLLLLLLSMMGHNVPGKVEDLAIL
jgi:hypothetical protein